MNYELLADVTSFDEDEEMLVFAFSANEGKSEKYVMFQYPLQTDEQDRNLHLDGLYVERDDQAFACYHGVKSIRRTDGRIEIDLNDEGKRRLKVERMVITPPHWNPAIDQGFSRLAELSGGEYSVQI